MIDPAPAARYSLIETLIGSLALLLALATVYQSWSNRTLQVDVAKNQARLAQAQTLANLDNSLIQMLAKSAVDNDDSALRDLLARNGVTFKAGTAAPKPTGKTAPEESKQEPKP